MGALLNPLAIFRLWAFCDGWISGANLPCRCRPSAKRSRPSTTFPGPPRCAAAAYRYRHCCCAANCADWMSCRRHFWNPGLCPCNSPLPRLICIRCFR